MPYAEVFSKKINLPADEVQDYYVSRIPIKRAATPRDIGDVVAFMCSAEAKYMVGQSINVPGGECLH